MNSPMRSTDSQTATASRLAHVRAQFDATRARDLAPSRIDMGVIYYPPRPASSSVATRVYCVALVIGTVWFAYVLCHLAK